MGPLSPATLDCPHQQAPAAGRICTHLIADPSLDHCRWFTGVGRVYALLCIDCAESGEGGADVEDQLGFVCIDCLRGAEEAGVWSPDRGILGAPEVVERPEEHMFVHDMVRLDTPLGAILDVRPIESTEAPVLVALLTSGALARVDLAGRTADTLVSSGPDPEQASLRLSARGDFAAVFSARGRTGTVFSLESRRPTMTLDRGAAGSYESEFPIAFFERDGRTLLAHESAQGRLDVSDPATGELLTARDVAESAYHHGTLSPSPDGAWIADSGYVDGPAGFVSVWSVERWLDENPRESDDGPSKKYFEQRWYQWDVPLCWTDERTLAIWGLGPAGDCVLDAALFYEVEAGEMLGWFPGPAGMLTFDDYLFSVSDELGTSVWDLETGARVHRDPGFFPQRYHAGARRFLSAQPDGDFFVVSRLVTRG